MSRDRATTVNYQKGFKDKIDNNRRRFQAADIDGY
jgi:hypothetical protein